MELYPSIDLRGGKCVRLLQGDFDKETVYSNDPIAVAKQYAASGARWIHVVDLDAASKRGSNRDVILDMAKSVDAQLQVGGGITEPELLGLGVSRIVFGSYALNNPAMVRTWLEMMPGRVAVAADHWNREVRDDAWQKRTGVDIRDFIRVYNTHELGAFIVTDISRDGTLEGPNIDLYRELVEMSYAQIIASGGVGGLEDLRRLASAGVDGVIVGKALYEGRFTVEEALAACRP